MMLSSCRLHTRQAPHGDNGWSLQPSLQNHTAQSFVVCVWCLLSYHPSTRDQVSACKRVSQCAVPLTGQLGFQLCSFSDRQSLLIFTASCCGNSSWHRTPGLGSSVWGLDPCLLCGVPGQGSVPPAVQPLSVSLGSAHFVFPLLLPVSMWPLVNILCYRGTVQLVFK